MGDEKVQPQTKRNIRKKKKKQIKLRYKGK